MFTVTLKLILDTDLRVASWVEELFASRPVIPLVRMRPTTANTFTTVLDVLTMRPMLLKTVYS